MSSSFWVCFLRLDKCLSPTSQQCTSTSHPSSPTHPLFIRYSSVIPSFYDRFWVGLTSDHCRVWCRHHPASGMSYLHEIVTYSDTFADGNVTEQNWTQLKIFCEAICWPLPSLNLESAMETFPVKIWEVLLVQNPGCPTRSTRVTRSNVWKHVKTMQLYVIVIVCNCNS